MEMLCISLMLQTLYGWMTVGIILATVAILFMIHMFITEQRFKKNIEEMVKFYSEVDKAIENMRDKNKEEK